MHRSHISLRSFPATPVALAALALAVAAPAQILTKTITYSRFGGPPDNVKQTVFTYDAGLATATFGPRISITSLPGADGILFSPDGSLIVGGQADAVHRVDISTGNFTTVNAGGVLSFHVMLDPSGTKVWTAGIPGFLSDVPILPNFLPATPHTIVGDDLFITHLGFVGNQVFYSESFPSGLGNFGLFDINTFTTTRLFSLVDWAHGMTFDCFTGDLIVYANNSVVQINPATQTIRSQLDTTPLGTLQLDQGTSDGNGHLFIASNTGHMLFIDLTASGLVGSPLNFVAAPFLDDSIDDIAPDCGLGSPPSCPRTQGYWKNHLNWPH